MTDFGTNQKTNNCEALCTVKGKKDFGNGVNMQEQNQSWNSSSLMRAGSNVFEEY